MKCSRTVRFLPASFFASLIYWVSDRTHDVSLAHGSDKIVHAAVFGFFALLLLWGDRWPARPRAWAWASLAAIYGILDEIHQSYVPGRMPEIFDAGADFVGAFAVVAVALVVRARAPL